MSAKSAEALLSLCRRVLPNLAACQDPNNSLMQEGLAFLVSHDRLSRQRGAPFCKYVGRNERMWSSHGCGRGLVVQSTKSQILGQQHAATHYLPGLQCNPCILSCYPVGRWESWCTSWQLSQSLSTADCSPCSRHRACVCTICILMPPRI